jgi:hypothetical protein
MTVQWHFKGRTRNASLDGIYYYFAQTLRQVIALSINQGWNTLILVKNMIPWPLVLSTILTLTQEMQKSGEKYSWSEGILNAPAFRKGKESPLSWANLTVACNYFNSLT